MVGQMLVADIVQVVVIRILCQTSVEVCPSQNVLYQGSDELKGTKITNHCILLIFNRFFCDLRKEEIMEHVSREVGLYGKTLHQEFLIKLLSGLLTHQDATSTLFHLLTRGMSDHLKHVSHGIIRVAMLASFKELNPHDDDHMCIDGQTPCGFLSNSSDLQELET